MIICKGKTLNSEDDRRFGEIDAFAGRFRFVI